MALDDTTVGNFLAAQHEAARGRPVTYTRGANSVPLTVTLGRTGAEVRDADGRQRTEWADRDYLFRAASLILGGVLTVPQKGDQITDGTEVYEVQPAAGEKQQRKSDLAGVRLRVHTKRIA